MAFENGVEIGSLHRDKLVREAEWDAYLVQRERSQEIAESDSEGQDSSGGSDSPSSGSGGVEVNGVLVPPLLLDPPGLSGTLAWRTPVVDPLFPRVPGSPRLRCDWLGYLSSTFCRAS